MLTGAIAREQIEDRIRAASADRTAREVAGQRRVRRTVRTMGSGLAAIMRASTRTRVATHSRVRTTAA